MVQILDLWFIRFLRWLGKVGEGGIHKRVKKRHLYLKKLNLKITHVKTIQVNWSAHCAANSIMIPYISFASFQSRGG